VQIKALLISTAVTTAAGAAVLLGTRVAGVDAHSMATVSSWQAAVLVAQQQRVSMNSREHFHFTHACCMHVHAEDG
jgi:hypothetical protein